MNDQWLTTKEALSFIKKNSKTTLYRIVRLYGIRQSRLLRTTYFNREDLDRVLNENAFVWEPE
ncbi:MAG: DNA-binding protein, partial [Sphingobacteriaceae bacterium]